MNLASLDLNLLVSLDALLGERGVTRAAERLGLSQPALSSALRRLRRHFGDELLVRVGNTYKLTPLAIFLRGRVAQALEGVDRVFDAKPEFDPTQCSREFSVVTSDYALSVVGPPLLAAMSARAPHARIRFRQPALATVSDAVGDLRASDVLICPHGYSADPPYLDLFRDRWVCIVAEQNPKVGDAVTVEELSRLQWVTALDQRTAYTPAHKQLELLGVSLDIGVITDGFVSVPGLVAGTLRVALMQERLINTFPPELGIRVLECPFEALPLMVALWWHPLYDQDPEHQLLRSAFSDVALALAELPDSPTDDVTATAG
jgi:DNA-binding transcriptional LysR family regulator